MKKETAICSLTLLLVLLSTSVGPSAIFAAGDDRFFGTYCGTYQENYDVPVCIPFLPFICWKETRTATFSVTTQIQYNESAIGHGVVSGKSILDGEGSSIPIVFSGTVISRGRITGSGLAQGWEHTTATATLSPDGMTITARALDRTIVLHKNACSNNAPAVRITTEAASFPWGRLNFLYGEATDPEDGRSFAEKRLVWRSDKDLGWRKFGLSASLNDLSPGDHQITFAAIDSGGIQAVAAKGIHIGNDAPRVQIVRPLDGATFYVGQRIPFEGEAIDTESGRLSNVDGALVWQDNAGQRIGTGRMMHKSLPTGDHRITLQVSDGALSGTASVNISVQICPDGNCPPTVSILQPDRNLIIGNGPGDCIALEVDVAYDPEDGELSGDAIVWQDLMEGATEVRILETTGRRVLGCAFPAGDHDTKHTITVTATDSSGRAATSSQTIYVTPVEGGVY